jgi:hypothetical protein
MPEDDDFVYVGDDDDTESDFDVCETCGCPRGKHEDSRKACACGRCKRFKEGL